MQNAVMLTVIQVSTRSQSPKSEVYSKNARGMCIQLGRDGLGLQKGGSLLKKIFVPEGKARLSLYTSQWWLMRLELILVPIA